MNQRLGKKSRSRKEVLETGARCIYCGNLATSLEHMPPRGIFQGKLRPSGMEFPCCQTCNNGTSTADLVASFFAKLGPEGEEGDWFVEENRSQLNTIDKKAPGLLEELFRKEKEKSTLWRSPGGVLQPKLEIHADGPLVKAYLSVFAGKFGMAMYREHTGQPLPLTGGVECVWYLNAGMSQKTAETLLGILPGRDTLRQGSWQVPGQFSYAYNTDGKGIVATLASFHQGLHIFAIAAADPVFYGLPHEYQYNYYFQPGGLVDRIPQRIKKPAAGIGR